MRQSFVIRKFALQLAGPSQSLSFGTAMDEFRTLENRYTSEMVSLLEDGLNISHFREKGGKASNKIFSILQFHQIEFTTRCGAPLQSRTKRAAFYYPYYAVRNGIIAAANCHSIIRWLQTKARHDWGVVISYLKAGALQEDAFRELRRALSLDIFGQRQNLPQGLLQNHIRMVRNRLFNVWEEETDAQACSFLSDDDLRNLNLGVLTGFTRKNKGQELSITPADLPAEFTKNFNRRMKGESTRAFKRVDRNSNSRGALIKQLRKVPYLDNPLREWSGVDLKSFKDMVTDHLKAAIQVVASHDLEGLISSAVNTVIEDYIEAHVKTILKPRYTRFRALGTFTEQLPRFIENKLQNKVRELLPNLLLSDESPFSSSIRHVLGELSENGGIWKFFNTPTFRKYTIHIPSRDHFYDVNVDKATQTVKISLRIYPANPGRGVRRPQTRPPFEFLVPPKALKRVVLRGEAWDDAAISTFFRAAPVLQLKNGRIILCPPIPNDPPTQQQPTAIATPDTVIGIDLGLKHYVVVSVMQQQGGQMVEIGRHFLGQRNVFNRTFDKSTRRFVKVPEVIPVNVHRKLEHLHKRLRNKQQERSKADQDHLGSRYGYLLGRDEKYLWQKIQNLHTHMVHLISHTVLEIAEAYSVSTIKVEDLTWAQHSPKREVGAWLAHHQVRWFHSRILHQLACEAYRQRVRVDLVNARYSSQICAEHSSLLNERFTRGQSAGNLRTICAPVIGNRQGKVFKCPRGHEIDADLNAARNLAHRPPLSVIT